MDNKDLDNKKSAAEVTLIPEEKSSIEDEGILKRKEDGHLILEEEVKEKILRAFKDGGDNTSESDTKSKSIRIFMKDDKPAEEEAEENTQSAAVKAVSEEMRSTRSGDIMESLENSLLLQQKLPETASLNLTHAEVVITSGINYAVAVKYSPGTVPLIAAAEKGGKAEKLIQNAFKLDIPVVEVPEWEGKNFKKLRLGQEIPEILYPVAAKALALIYRMKTDAHLVRYIKPAKKIKSKRKSKVKSRIQTMKDVLAFSIISVELGSKLYISREELQTQLELTANRLTAELGLPIPKVDIKLSNAIAPEEYLLLLKETLYDAGSLNLSFEPPELFYHLQASFKSLVYNNSFELLGYPEVEALLDHVKKSQPGLVRSLFPHQFTVGALRFVLKGLLKEKIPIKDMTTILQTIEEYAPRVSDPELLIEYVRSAFSHFISSSYRDEEGNLNVILLSREAEQQIMESVKEIGSVRWLDMKYEVGLNLLSGMGEALSSCKKLGIPVVFLVSPVIRRFVRKITEANYPEVPVLSYSEINPLTPVKTMGIVSF